MTLRELIWKDIGDERWFDPLWQIKNSLKGLLDLKDLPFFNGFESKRLSSYETLLKKYKWASTPYYLNLIDLKRENDPIKAQVIPDLREIETSFSISSPDPLLEKRYMPVPGLIHRYEDRALLLVTNSCFSYCRHCNRKRAWSRPESISFDIEGLERIKKYLSDNTNIREVILSGGDPLTLSHKRLESLLAILKQIENIQVIRIGTRAPVVLPMAVTKELCDLLKRYRPIWINTHFNHPVEITAEAKRAIELFQLSGIPISNQTVLLKGINDELHVLKELFCKLQSIMVRPYYLFQCDYVSGVDHFRVNLKRGIDIMRKLWGRIGGMCIPEFVADLPQGLGKARLLHAHLLELDDSEAVFATFEGKITKVKIT